MPIYMDVHIVPGVKARNVAEAHQLDLLHQHEFGCNCMTYWIDEGRESIFCLIEAPEKAAVVEMHRKAHGLVPNKIIEVSRDVVESFLGRIYDPEEAEKTDDGLKVFADPSFRVLLITQTTDPVLIRHYLGSEKAKQLLNSLHAAVREKLSHYGGREVEHAGSGFIISFTSAVKAVSCALSVLNDLNEADCNQLGFKMSIASGEPIEKSNKLFGDCLSRAQHMCAVAKYLQIAISSSVKELVEKDFFEKGNHRLLTLPPQDEALLNLLYNVLETHWQNAEFDIDDFCKEMAMSKSQLYRKTMALTGFSPNILLKEFRLEKAKEMMKKQFHNISQVTFDSGFTSASYFTKCFKQKYGILPMSYIEMLQ